MPPKSSARLLVPFLAVLLVSCSAVKLPTASKPIDEKLFEIREIDIPTSQDPVVQSNYVADLWESQQQCFADKRAIHSLVMDRVALTLSK